ncbi:NACHT, LRR and PYD domains-containing protein 12-like [Strongylocentrotus purpuratus]|uniref:Uncharacterized protein n=1 Tax=Strongylocentrotus purpuratus TaxID=7668 RepID=A0A7M7NCU6_STRPU|nr:NACHT, LRR and PYD domains-containing protein 12-like [Strongylocentrotus purpuratus]
MPKLTNLKLERDLTQEFYSTLKEKASSIEIQTLKLDHIECPTPASSHHLAEAVSSMPNLTDLTLYAGDFNEDFYSTLTAKASSIQVQTLQIERIHCPTPASSHHLAEALCSMPNLTNLSLSGEDLTEDLCYTLKANASSIQVQNFQLARIKCPTPASSHHFAEALCSMPNLTYLTLLGGDLNEELCYTLKAKASSLQVQSLELDGLLCPTPASSQHLAEAMCSMPNLTDLELYGGDLTEDFNSTLKAMASSIQGCFPQIRKGNFRFNEQAQDDLDSFLQTLTCSESLHESDGSNDSDNSADLDSSSDSYVSADLDGSSDSYVSADLDSSNDLDGSAHSGKSHDFQLCSVV